MRASGYRIITDPPIATLLFGDTRLAPIWALVRLYAAWTWLDSGWRASQDPGGAQVFIAYCGIAIGVALGVGAFTGIAASGGVLLSLGAGINAGPGILVASFALILAWKTAGYLGLDRLLLPALGTPWHDGRLRVRSVDTV